MPELIGRNYFLIEPMMVLVKLHDNSIVLAGIVAPHERMSRVFSQAEYANQLPQNLLKFLPLSFPYNPLSYAVQYFSFVSLHLCHKLLLQSRIGSNQFTENWNGDEQFRIIRVGSLLFFHHGEECRQWSEYRGYSSINLRTEFLRTTLKINQRAKFKRIVKIRWLSESN